MSRHNWTPERLTPRDVMVDRDITITANCSGCRYIVELNVWTIGAQMADDPFQTMRFRCRRCGAYAKSLIDRPAQHSPRARSCSPSRSSPGAGDQGQDEKQQAALSKLNRGVTSRSE